MGTFGTELIQELADGSLKRRSSKTAEATREKVVPGLLELIEHGARVRPMRLNGVQVGWVRGFHPSERRLIFDWFLDSEDRLTNILRHATTLTPEAIDSLTGPEAQNILRQVGAISEADASLYPYISAFSTTTASEMLWYGRGAGVATWSRSEISLPGASFTLLAPPEHARLWAGVALLRERSKKRLDDTFNAAMITKAMVGKGADKLFASLKKTQQALQSDNLEPWLNLVPPETPEVKNDGWGHAHVDESREGLIRELEGMNSDDKHEQLMAKFYEQQMSAAQSQAEEVDELVDEFDGIDDVVTVLTAYQVRAMEEQSRQHRDQLDTAVRDGLDQSNQVLERRERRAMGYHEPGPL